MNLAVELVEEAVPAIVERWRVQVELVKEIF
jgi:hypothetical protein